MSPSPTGIVAALVPVVSGGAVLAGTKSRADTRGVLLFVGDSNVVLASMQIVARVSWFDAIVNNLGIKDTIRAGTETTPGYSYYGRKIDWFMRLIPKQMPAYWTNLPCAIEPTSLYDGCKAVNTALAAARGRWSNLVLVNWAARANSHPEYLAHAHGKPEVHNDSLGAETWIEQINAAIDLRVPAR